MSDTMVNGFTVRVTQGETLGAPWLVKVYKKRLFFKQRISSDWFLDGDQARRFADGVMSDLRDGNAEANLLGRRPGWTLHRAKH
jgi:hypothetical protein